MPILGKLRKILDDNNIRYRVVTHSEAYTAQELAAAEHVPGDQMAKVVMVRHAGKSLMAVLPATRRIDFEMLHAVLGGESRLETEEEFKDLFPGCETGAEPPFGNLFGLDVLVDGSLAKHAEITFNAGTHRDSICMRYEDYNSLVRPRIESFSVHA